MDKLVGETEFQDIPERACKPCVPEPAPLAMPEQGRDAEMETVVEDIPLSASVILWRLLMAALVIGFSGFFTYELYQVLSPNSITTTQLVLLVLSAVTFTWIAFGAATAICGFVGLVSGARLDNISIASTPDRLNSRTALLFPVYNEDPAAVAETIKTVASDLHASRLARHFDFFLLSDSADPAQRLNERLVFARLRASIDGYVRLYYRWREENHGKKAGNVAEWITSHGGAYDHFIIFDADSVMTSQTLRRLAATMEINPQAGLIQTVPRLSGARTLMGHIQLFAAQVYGHLLAMGSALWQGHESNYWGHNAIIRTKAFASSAGLPEFPGRAPFGATVQSHDFVEAAFLRKAGWGVYLIPSMGGSYEGCPPNIFEILVRDRRWCQGNMQHMRFLFWPGLKPVSRLHLLTGIVSYLASFFWLSALMAGLYTSYQFIGHEHDYFPDHVTLFPNWPIMDSERALTLLVFTLSVLLLPKTLGLAYGLFFDKNIQNAGLRLRMVGGCLIELILSAVIAPIFMLAHVWSLVMVALGQDSGWSTQIRDPGQPKFTEAIVVFAPFTIIGLLLAGLCFWISVELGLWLAPVFTGLIFAPFISWTTSMEIEGTMFRLPAVSRGRVSSSARMGKRRAKVRGGGFNAIEAGQSANAAR